MAPRSPTTKTMSAERKRKPRSDDRLRSLDNSDSVRWSITISCAVGTTWLLTILTLSLCSTATAAFVSIQSPPIRILKCRSRFRHYVNSSPSSSRHDDDSHHEFECPMANIESYTNNVIEPSIFPAVNTRRHFVLQQLLFASTICPTATQAASADTSLGDGYFSLRNNNNMPYAQRQRLISQQRQQERSDRRRERSSSSSSSSTSSSTSSSLVRTKKWTPFANVKRWDCVETCLLEMLPVKNVVFRQLQELIEDLEVYPMGSSGWKQTLSDSIAVLSLLNSKRSSLEPVFYQEDQTELYIAKSSLGERNVETLRSILEEMIDIASGEERTRLENSRRNSNNNNIDGGTDNIDPDAFSDAKRRALFALSELGELLVPSFPYAVPTRGKFGYLPRLLGRCTVTLSFERPSSSTSALGVNFSGNDKQQLGNVTIVADGYAAPITAGNFVDLSVRNFYTGLSVRAMRKRLGVVPIASDNVILNDLTELRDNFDELKDSALEFPETLKKDTAKGVNDRRGSRSEDMVDPLTDPLYNENRMTMDVVLPILGSFQEGFYDPLTAKPRRIPLEVVTLDKTSPTKSTLTYSSSYASLDDEMADSGTTRYSGLASSSSSQRSFSSATSSSSSDSTTASASNSNLDPVLSFDIPGLVALNHPDRASNGGSSEFFSLLGRDISSKKSELLDGQYAPFGYIVSGSDIYQSLRPGDVIKATYVSEVGLLNLVKIRKNAFEGGEDVVIEEESDGES